MSIISFVARPPQLLGPMPQAWRVREHLKKSSICHREQYSSVIVMAGATSCSSEKGPLVADRAVVVNATQRSRVQRSSLDARQHDDLVATKSDLFVDRSRLATSIVEILFAPHYEVSPLLVEAMKPPEVCVGFAHDVKRTPLDGQLTPRKSRSVWSLTPLCVCGTGPRERATNNDPS